MNKHLSATLDLVKVIQVFTQRVKTLLELDRVDSSEGNTIKEREQAIRDAALILAGECIALLLFNWEQSEKVNLASRLPRILPHFSVVGARPAICSIQYCSTLAYIGGNHRGFAPTHPLYIEAVRKS